MSHESDEPQQPVAETSSQVRAAAYVRMSTELQTYSVENQLAAIQAYAAKHDMLIVRKYNDEAISGVRAENRPALGKLLNDVQSGNLDFEVVLIYDVSRWGRFLDPDESAYYEFLCRRSGLAVQYCAEPFENDGSSLSTILKNIKRSMAGEYSRELSVKTFAGQSRMASRGFLVGASAGYGLRRMLVGPDGARKVVLQHGHRKNIKSDRIILVPGPSAEVATVLRIYKLFLENHLSAPQIASLLNGEGLRSEYGRPWQAPVVRRILTGEKYIGNLVYNRTSTKLGAKRRPNDPSRWIRCEGAFEAIVPEEQFFAVRDALAKRIHTDEQLLKYLRAKLASDGHLSRRSLEGTHGPSIYAICRRFGSLCEAYRRIGYKPLHNCDRFDDKPMIQSLRRSIVFSITEGIKRGGGWVTQDPGTGLLTINGEVTAALIISRCQVRARGRWVCWAIPAQARADLAIVARMDPTNTHLSDLYLLSRSAVAFARGLLNKTNCNSIDVFRFRNLAALYAAADRIRLIGPRL